MEYNKCQPKDHVVHTITDSSPKVLADTIIEMGGIVHGNRQVIQNLIYDLQEEQYKNNTKQRQLNEVSATLKEREQLLNDYSKKLQELEKVLYKKVTELTAELVTRDIIIDNILSQYEIKPHHKRKINKLRAELPVNK